MTNRRIVFLVAVISSSLNLLAGDVIWAQSNARWWQREIPLPGANQIVNPDYTSKKRELEITWDEYQKGLQARKHFRSLGQRTSSIDASIQDLSKKMNRLEYELSGISMFINRPQEKTVVTGEPENRPPKLDNSSVVESTLRGWSGIQVTFNQFSYVSDPNGIDWRSFPRLGVLAAYVVRVYPAAAMKPISSIIEQSQELGYDDIGITLLRNDSQYVSAIIGNPRSLIEGGNELAMMKAVEQKAIFQFIFDSDLSYAIIPLPTGIYYLEYSLIFPRSRNPSFTFCHPNYVGRSIDEPAEYSTSWGPAKIEVRTDIASQIDFSPTLSIAGYEYVDDPIKKGIRVFEGSHAWRDWLSFLRWKGVYVLDHEDE